jgi:lysophospholipase L1-like esterase
MVDSDADGSAKYRLDRLKETDTTLSVSGKAADAAATGQAISAETQARTQAVTAETQARQQAITAESQARQAANTTLRNDVDDLKSAISELLFVEDCPFVRELYINDAGITGNVEKLHSVNPDGQNVGRIQFSNAAGSSVTALCLPVTSADLLSYKPIPIYSATDTRTIFGYILFDWSYFTEYTVISKQINEIAYKPEFSPSIKEYLQKGNVDSIKSSVASINEFIAELGYTQEIDINYESRKLPNPDGSFYTDNGSTQTFFGSGYIRIPQGAERVKYLGIGYSSTAVTPIAFYTEDFTFISAVPVTSFKIYEGIVSIPSNAVYFYQSKYEKAGDSRTSDNYTFFLFGEEKVSIDSLSDIGYPTKVYNADAFTKTDVPKTDGTSYTATGWYATDFIYCKGSESVDYNVYVYPSIAAVAFYDSSKTLIDYVTDSLGHMITGRVAVPSNAEYVRGANANNNPAYIKVNACGLYIAKEQVPLTQGMKICCVGDSLTKGVDVGSHVIKESYPYFMSQYLDCFVVNYGHPGVSAKGWWNSDHLTKTFDSNMDVVLIMFGTNGGLAINTLATDVEPYDDWEDYADTECGCYCKLIESIQEQTQNHAQIILMTPPYSTYSEGQTQTVIATAPVIRAIAQRYCLPVIDVLYESGMNAFNGDVFRPHDGCHFNAKGYHRLGTFVGSKVKSVVSTFSLDDVYDDETT